MSRRGTILVRETRPPSEPASKLWWLVVLLLLVIVLPDFGWRRQTVDWLKGMISAFDNDNPTVQPIAAPPHDRPAPPAPPPKEIPPPPQLTVALTADNRCMIELTLNGIGPFPFVVDTGAPGVAMPADMGRRLGIDLRKIPPDHGSGGWGGGSTTGVFVTLKEIRLKNFRLQHFEVAVENETVATMGLAGITFLNQLRNFELSNGLCKFWW
jgi:clan AA aspartic protease (TIGR02281 family)